ncbi:MAG: transposase [Candidatus Thiodiazotropha sp. (ex Lucinoma kastoroae)]|nr:transposase [Candidatus Thiodiazotropha sp. (ex Rostrolucina anterorostrata)]MCU7847959.1 transposase [Candidatus Thiodiazotropha sp. (ex Lucinoma kastoroae)]
MARKDVMYDLLKRAIRSGMEADYVLADAWFGTKPMIRTAWELDTCARFVT